MANGTRSVAQWTPFQDVLTLREAMNQLFEESVVRPNQSGRSSSERFVPAVDLSETDNAYIVEASVPGMKAEDLNITVENNVLYISGEIRQEKKTEEQNYHHVERRFGRFQRSLTLPNTVKFDEISASLNNGVLHLEIPKADEVKPRQISVKVETA